MRVAVDKSFSQTHPYSKFLVAKLHFAGPVYKSRWAKSFEDDRNVLVEEMAEALTKEE